MWLFDEGQGDVAKNSSDNDNDMDLNNDVAWIEGKSSKALEFDWVDDIAMVTVPGASQGTGLMVLGDSTIL